MIISFMGVNGAGKSTQCRLLKNYLRKSGKRAEIVKPVTDDHKKLFGHLIKHNSLEANYFLFCMFYRNQAEEIIRLKKDGFIVLADRYIESFRLFHRMYGLLKRGDLALYKELESMTFFDTIPDIMVYLKVDMETANDRIKRRNRLDANYETQRIYLVSTEFFSEIAQAQNCITIDGTMDEESVHHQIKAALRL